MANKGGLAGAGWVLAYIISISGTILVLCGLAAMQNLCHTGDPIVTNSRRLLQMDPSVALATCSKAYRFQWWGWALQTTFVTLVGVYWCIKFKHAGVMIVGGCSTVLAMIFANEQLQASDAFGGKVFSRATLTFVGWLLVCTGNFLQFLTASHLPGEGGEAATGKYRGADGGAAEVSATTA